MKKDNELNMDYQFARQVVEGLAESFLASGDLKEEDLKNQKILLSKMKKILKQYELKIVIDHRNTLLEHANKFLASDDLNLSILFYTIYFEHELNAIIVYALTQKSISQKSKNELIRAVNIVGKCTWLLEILGLPTFNKKHGKLITDISAERNAFLHYKWNPDPNDDVDSSYLSSLDEKKIDLINQARKTATYIKKYSSNIQFKGKKGRLKKVLKNT